MCVTDFARAYEFYTTRFNFKASDVSGTSEMCFISLTGCEKYVHMCKLTKFM